MKENESLVALWDADREMTQAAVAQDRSPQAVQTALEKAMDRLMYRYAEQCVDPAMLGAAQLAVKTMKSALPLMDSVGETRRWQKSLTEEKPKPEPIAWAALAVGGVLILSVMLGLMLSGGRVGGALTFLEALLPAALGGAALFWAGRRFARPKAVAKAGGAEDVRDEFLVDVDKLMHHLRGMLLLADSAVEAARADAEAERQHEERVTETIALPDGQAELFAGLLENAYAQQNADSREMIENIRFYLHNAQVEVADYAQGRDSWFEFLPAPTPGTIRPALVSGDKLVRKGLAAR